MSSRTSEQALKDARPAYNAWCDGKPIELLREGDDDSKWELYNGNAPAFSLIAYHWRPKPEPSPLRTPQQAMREARESGAVEAWERGEPIERCYHGYRWTTFVEAFPSFADPDQRWRPKRAEPPKPVALDCRPVS